LLAGAAAAPSKEGIAIMGILQDLSAHRLIAMLTLIESEPNGDVEFAALAHRIRSELDRRNQIVDGPDLPTPRPSSEWFDWNKD
jgi:hypothetical protein